MDAMVYSRLSENAAPGILCQVDQMGRNLPASFRRSLEREECKLRRPSANSGRHPQAQMKIAGTMNLVKGVASLGSRPAFMNAPFRCWTFLWFSGRRLTMLRPALDHNINGVAMRPRRLILNQRG